MVGIVLQIAIAVVGMLLVLTGLRGRCIGTEQRCARCGYDLTGGPGDTCSECGGALGPASVVVGRRFRRRGVLIGGLALIAADCIAMGLFLRSYDLLRRAPFGVVLMAARVGSDAAYFEVFQRYAALRLSPAEIRILTETALAECGNRSPMRAPPDWMNILRRMHGRNDIAPDLQQAMYRVVDPQVKAQLRPTAGRDTPFPVIFELSLLNPVSGLKPDLRSWRLERGGEVVGGPVQPASTGPGSPERSDGPSSTPLAGRAAAMPQPFNRGAIWLGRTTLPVGRHELILVVDIGLKPVDPGRTPIDWTKRVVTPITLEVAPKGQDIQLVRSSDVDAALRRCLFMAGSYFKPSVRAAVRSIRMPQASRHAVAELGHVPLNFPAPVDAAIQVRVLLADGGVAQPLIAEALISATEVDIVDGRSGSDAVEPALLTIGLLLCYKDSRDAWFLAERSPACLDAVLRDPAARIVLEPAPDAARRTPEMVRIWGGQLMLRPHEAPIPVRPPLPTALDRFR